MTPGEHILAEASAISVAAGHALGKLNIALARRQISVHTLNTIEFGLMEAHSKTRELVKFVERMQEENGRTSDAVAAAIQPKSS